MIVCLCRVVSDRTIQNVIEDGATSVESVAAACRAGTGCGACRPHIARMLAEAGACPDGDAAASACSDCPRKTFELTSPYLAATGEAA